MTYNSILPRILQTGAGASQQIHQVLASLGCHKPLIITDRMMVELGYAGRISAKAIGILAKFGGVMRDYKFPRNVTEMGLPIIAIPTTAGTGSEVTRFTIITDESTDEKMLCVGAGFMPVAALVDYELTLSLPPRVTADTGIDALTHAIEAYVSKKRICSAMPRHWPPCA